MELAKYFFDELREDKSSESIKNAIHNVDEIFSKILLPETDEESCIQFLFEKKDKILFPRQSYYDLIALWNTMEPYIWNWTRQEIGDFWLMDVIVEAELVRQVNQYNQILDSETAEHQDVLNALAYSIEDIFNKKYIAEVERNQTGILVKAIYPLKRFDEQCYHPYRDFILVKLYELLCRGGMIAVVVGSVGLTPRRIYGYRMKDFHWNKWPVRGRRVREAIFEENMMIRRASVMTGYVLDDLW